MTSVENTEVTIRLWLCLTPVTLQARKAQLVAQRHQLQQQLQAATADIRTAHARTAAAAAAAAEHPPASAASARAMSSHSHRESQLPTESSIAYTESFAQPGYGSGSRSSSTLGAAAEAAAAQLLTRRRSSEGGVALSDSSPVSAPHMPAPHHQPPPQQQWRRSSSGGSGDGSRTLSGSIQYSLPEEASAPATSVSSQPLVGGAVGRAEERGQRSSDGSGRQVCVERNLAALAVSRDTVTCTFFAWALACG